MSSGPFEWPRIDVIARPPPGRTATLVGHHDVGRHGNVGSNQVCGGAEGLTIGVNGVEHSARAVMVGGGETQPMRTGHRCALSPGRTQYPYFDCRSFAGIGVGVEVVV